MTFFTPPSLDHRHHKAWKGIVLLGMIMFWVTSVMAQSEKDLYDHETLLFSLTIDEFFQDRTMLTIRDDIFRETGIPIKDITQPFTAWGNTLYWDNFYAITVEDPENINLFLEQLAGMEMVAEVLRVPLASSFQSPPNDNFLGSQWHLNAVKAQDAWSNFSPASSLPPVDPIVIAVVDDAVDLDHDDLTANLWTDPVTGNHGYDFADNDGDPRPPAIANGAFFNHGTHVAGIANAVTNNSLGVASLAYNVQLMSLKCASDNSSNPRSFGTLAVVNGINYAVAHGADIINLSLGTAVNFPPLEQAVFNARANDVIVVAAAGNDDTNVAPFPAGYPDVITVASTDNQNKKSDFSNYGPWVDISAPGTAIFSTLPDDVYGSLSGTSMATPLVASALALMKSYRPTVPNNFLIDCLLNNTTDISSQNPGFSGSLGSGLLNADLPLQCSAGLIANFTADMNSACVGETVTFTATQVAGATYSWDLGDGTPPTTPSSSNTYSHTYTSTLAGGIVTLTVNDGTTTETDQGTMVVSTCQTNDPTQGHWFFPSYGGVDFTQGFAQADLAACNAGTFDISGSNGEATSVISDDQGNLLFYTDGVRVWNGQHGLVTSALLGNSSRSQGALIVPEPGNPNGYIIFHISDRLLFSEVIVNSGNVTMGNINQPVTNGGIYNNYQGSLKPSGEEVIAIPSCEGYWIITTGSGNPANGSGDDLVVLSLTPTGLTYHNNFPISIYATYGYMKASPDGTKLAKASNTIVPGIELYDFDPVSGIISSGNRIETNATWGLSFSPNSQLLYATAWGSEVLQYDLSTANPTPVPISTVSVGMMGGIQLGPDDKIYIIDRFTNHLNTIHFPNSTTNPGFVYADVNLNPNSISCLGGAVMSNELGLPNLIDADPVILEQDQFTYTISNCYTYNFAGPACSSTYLWNFNDGKYSTAAIQNPTHTFSGPGTYDVTLTTDNFSMLQTIVVNDIDAEVIGLEEICEDDLGGTFSYFAQTNSGNFSYQWTATGGNIISDPTANLIDVTWTSLPAQLTLMVTDLDTDCQRQVVFDINECPPVIDGCTDCTEVVELVTNGDFELGAAGAATFNSQLANAQGCNQPGTFFIGSTAQDKCSLNAPDLFDHTVGNREGHYLIVDEYVSANNYLVWMQQGVNVTKGETYIFSFWHLRNLANARPTQYQEYVLWADGHVIDTITTLGATDKIWTRYCATWEADRSGNIPIAIYRVNNTNPTLPYGIDDISFGACVDCEVTAEFNNLGLYGSPWVSFYDRSTSTGTITGHSWDFGDPLSGVNNTSTSLNPSHRFSTAGLFEVCLTVTATQNGEECESTFCKTIKIVKERRIIILPNPIKGKVVNFEVEEFGEPFSEIAMVSVLDANTGAPLIQLEWNKEMENKVEVSNLKLGVYLLEVHTNDGERLQERFIMEK